MRYMLLLVVMLPGPPLARAQTSETIRASFRWSAEGCVDADRLVDAVRRRLGREPFVDARDAEIELTGRVTHERESIEATLEFVAPSGDVLGTRVIPFDAVDCSTLVEPIATVLAVMLNVHRDDLAPIEDGPTPLDPHRWGARISTRGGVILGTLPQPGLEVAVSVVAEQRCGISLGVEIAYDGSDGLAVDEGAIAVAAAAARATIGWSFLCGDVDLTLFVLGGGGPMWASTQGFAESGGGVAGFVDARLGARVGFLLGGPAWLYVAGDFGWLVLAPSFVIRDVDDTFTTLFTPAGPSGAFSVGIAFRIE